MFVKFIFNECLWILIFDVMRLQNKTRVWDVVDNYIYVFCALSSCSYILGEFHFEIYGHIFIHVILLVSIVLGVNLVKIVLQPYI
jgi:hypothetical protein